MFNSTATRTRFKEDKLSEICTSTGEPFRRTQTRINGRLKDYGKSEGEEGAQGDWEEAMDKNFENITVLVRRKKDAKEENIMLRHTLTETLDEIDQDSKVKKQIEEEVSTEKFTSASLEKDNKALQKELNKLKKMLGRESNSVIKQGDKLGNELQKWRYKVSKSQREYEKAMEEYEVTLNYQKYEQIEVLQTQIAESEEELMDLEHQCRNSAISVEKQAKRLKEKQKMIDEMVENQNKTTSPYGNVVIKQNTRDPELEYFSERLKRIVNN